MDLSPSLSAIEFGRERRARSIHRGLAALAVATLTNRNAREIVAAHWSRDHLANIVARGAVDPTVLSDFSVGAGSKLIFMSSIAPQSAAVRLFDRAFDLDLDGLHEATVTSITAPSPAFVGEGAPMPMVSGTTADAVLGPLRKVLLGTAISRQVEFATPASASALIGRAVSGQAEKSLDALSFDVAAADNVRPAGLLNNVDPISAASGTGLEAMTEDLGNLAATIAAAGGDPDRMMVFAAPKQAVRLRAMVGARFDNEIISVAALTDGTVVTIDPQGVGVAAEGPPEISLATHAVAHFEDATPLAIAEPGSPNTVAAPVRSAWQQDLLILKIRMRVTWAVLTPGTVQVVTGTNW